MCGRFLSIDAKDLEEVLKEFQMTADVNEAKMDEIFPTDKNIVQVKGGLRIMGWGIKTDWSKGRPIINARQETLEEKSFFKYDFKKNRCVIYAKGFYEWDNAKNKYLIQRTDQEILKFAGLYKLIDGVAHYVIITQAATQEFASIHDRLPLMLDDAEVDSYLNSEISSRWTNPRSFIPLKWEIVEKRKVVFQYTFDNMD